MSFDAAVYRVLIASPSDVGEEREIITEVINEWNAMSSFPTKIILMPVKWETHSSPLLGGRPQGILNEQIVKDADLLVGVFWTRIGTATGVAVSGTAEEIQQFVDSDKPVMLYFSQTPVSPDKIDIEQFTALQDLKETMRLKGLTESYIGVADFRQKFTRQLGINIHNLIDLIEKELKSKGKELSRKTKEVKSSAVEKLKIVPIEEAKKYLLKSLELTSRDDGWADMAAFAKHLHTYTPVMYKDYGFSKLKPYLESTGLFEFNSISNTQIEIRLAQKTRS